MDINCTLFIQCLNFGIAYVVLSRLIFKPILECILEERAKRDALQQAITTYQEEIRELDALRTASWQQAQSHFGSYLKTIPYQPRTMPFTYQYEYESATDAEVNAHAHRVHDAIMRKVTDDFK